MSCSPHVAKKPQQAAASMPRQAEDVQACADCWWKCNRAKLVRQPGQSLPVGHRQVPASKLQVSED